MGLIASVAFLWQPDGDRIEVVALIDACAFEHGGVVVRVADAAVVVALRDDPAFAGEDAAEQSVEPGHEVVALSGRIFLRERGEHAPFRGFRCEAGGRINDGGDAAATDDVLDIGEAHFLAVVITFQAGDGDDVVVVAEAAFLGPPVAEAGALEPGQLFFGSGGGGVDEVSERLEGKRLLTFGGSGVIGEERDHHCVGLVLEIIEAR
jgi:hypothetical protein